MKYQAIICLFALIFAFSSIPVMAKEGKELIQTPQHKASSVCLTSNSKSGNASDKQSHLSVPIHQSTNNTDNKATVAQEPSMQPTPSPTPLIASQETASLTSLSSQPALATVAEVSYFSNLNGIVLPIASPTDVSVRNFYENEHLPPRITNVLVLGALSLISGGWIILQLDVIVDSLVGLFGKNTKDPTSASWLS